MARLVPLPLPRASSRLPSASIVALSATTALCAMALLMHRTGEVYVWMCASLAAFAWLLWCELRERRIGVRPVLIAGVVLTILAVAFPMRTSRDIWAYADYGQMLARHHASPYVSVPADFPQDFWFQHVNERWQNTGSVYGPLFAGTAAVFMKVAGDSLLVTRLMFQIFAAAIMALVAWLVWRRTRDPMALALIVVNPLVVISVVNGGHNDPLVALGILGSILLLEKRKLGAAGLVLALGALVKIVALLPGAAIAFWLWRRRSSRDAVVFGASLAAVFLGGIALAGGVEVFTPLRGASELVGFSSFWHAILKVVSGGTFRGPTAATGRAIVRLLSGVTVLTLCSVIVMARAKRSEERTTIASLLAIYLLAASYVLPWYTVWLLPVAALAWRSRLTLIMVAYSSMLTMSYFPLSSRTGGWVRTTRTIVTGAMGPVEVAAIVGVVLLAVAPARRALRRAA